MNILITGGASGLGKAITGRLAADSSNTIHFTYSRSQESASALEAAFPNVTAIKCDYADAVEVAALAGKLALLDPDVLIHNAYHGDFLKAHFLKIDVEEFSEDFRINILPVITITQSALRVFRKKRRGKIITVLTAALDNVPPVGAAVYVANKAYLERLTKVWAGENVRYNITSNSVSPSFMETGLTGGMDERLIENIKESHPLKKLLSVDEVADSIAYLTLASSQINGIDLLINAGATIR